MHTPAPQTPRPSSLRNFPKLLIAKFPKNSSGTGQAVGFDNRSVELGTTIQEAINLMFAGNADAAFLAGERWIDVRQQHFFLDGIGCCQRFAVGSADFALANELKPD